MTINDFRVIAELAVPLFLIMDPVGNSGACLSLLKGERPGRQRMIIVRELFIALGIMIFFQFLGGGLLAFLNIHQSTLRLAGGVILFIISMRMVFPSREEGAADADIRDPFIVPIAVPLIAGPSLLAAIMLYSHRDVATWHLLSAIIVAWSVSLMILAASPTLTRVLGRKGMRAAERLMGLVLILLSIQMLEDGARMFIESLG